MSRVPTLRWADLDAHGSESFEPLLSSGERRRARTLRFARDRSRFIAARGLLRTLLGARLGTDPELIEFDYGEHGKPRLAGGDQDLRFNLSHSAGVAAFAFCEGREVGIDVEVVREELFAEGIPRRYLPPEAVDQIERRSGPERTAEFFRAWVRQEAYAKGRGGGLELIGRSPARGAWSVVDLEPIRGCAAALAIERGGDLDGGEQLVADLAGVGHPGVELLQVVDVPRVGTAQPAL